MIIEPTYNVLLIALSYFVSVFGSYTGLQLTSGIKENASSRVMWITSAAFALGGGAIWTMHFIGMLAYDISMPVGYDPLLTFVSLLVAVAFTYVGIYIVSQGQNSFARLLFAGLITGTGVASMHYTGMAAMVMPAKISYDTTLVIISIVIALVAATVALWLAFNLTGNLQKLGSAFVMGAAVCGMHYTGMAAASMTPTDQPMVIEATMDPLTLGLFIFCFSMLLLVLCLIMALSQLNKRMYEELEGEGSIQ